MISPLLQVIGRGAVSPAGCSVTALTESLPVPPTEEAIISRPARSVKVRRVETKQAELLKWQPEPRLRRASPLSLFLVEAGHQALAQAPALPRERVGLVCALSTGSIHYSRKFFAETLQHGRRVASPALFPETVYNSPVSHLATVLKITGACYTVMGDESAWVDALRVAQVWLARKSVEAVLVVGGLELDPIALEGFDRAGWARRGLVASEGAGAILVQSPPPDASPENLVQVSAQTLSFRTLAEQRFAWETILAQGQPELPFILPAHFVPLKGTNVLPSLHPSWGLAFTASVAWDFFLAEAYRPTHGPFQLLVPGTNTAVTSVAFL